MAKARSPRYPTIGLSEALDRVRMVYEADHQNKIPKHVVAEHMGYGSLNGKSLGVISAVSKFGLLEGRADEMWVSDRALTILAHAPGSPERARAVREAAREPDLFVELDAQFPGKASDSAIRSYLLTKRKFLPEAADKLIRSYRDTRELVERESDPYDSPEVTTGDVEESGMKAASSIQQSSQPPLGPPPSAPKEGSAPYTVQLTGDRLRGSFDVDAQGLKKLLKILKAQQALLDMDDDDQESEEAAQ